MSNHRISEDDAVARDLDSLRVATGKNVPPLESMTRSVRPARDSATNDSATSGGWVRSILHGMRARPWVATGAVAAAVALVLLVVPVSYQRTTGQTVSLRVAGPDLEGSAVSGIVDQLQRELGVSRVGLDADVSDDGSEYTLSAFVPVDNPVNVKAVANAFVAMLADNGYEASSSVVPRVGRHSGNVYAMARNAVIRISIDNKSDAELEAEIRNRLLDAGVHDPQVSVSDEGDRGKRVEVTSDYSTDDPNEIEVVGDEPTIVLTKGGQDLVPGNGMSEGFSVREKIVKKDGSMTRLITVSANGRTAEVEVDGALNDDELVRVVGDRLHEEGIDCTVTAVDGKLRIEKP